MHKKGIVLTNVLIQAWQDGKLFNKALDFLTQFDLKVVEFYANEAQTERYAQAIRDRNFEPVFLTALAQKWNSDCRICSEDEDQRVRSVNYTSRIIESAISSGAKRTLIQSGAYPKDPAKEVICMGAIEKSLQELSEFAGNDIRLQLEPCDRSVDTFQLLGPSLQVYSLMKKLSLTNVGLTMDVAHITELFEDPDTALQLCKPYCDHVHIANCVLDPTSSQFGDKHPLFGVEKGCYSVDGGNRIYQDALKFYENEDLYISMEMINRDIEPMSFLSRLVDNTPWFFLSDR